MATTSDFKRGMRLLIDGDPWVLLNYSTQTPSARGAATLVKTKIRNLRTKQLVDRTFKSGDRVSEPDFEMRPCQYLYSENKEFYYFMDEETYEQFPLNRDDIEYELGFIRETDVVRAMMFEGRCIGIEIPNTVVLEVVECDPGVRGDTVNNVNKPAKLQTGLKIQVPLFVEVGDKLIVDTRDARYIKRG